MKGLLGSKIIAVILMMAAVATVITVIVLRAADSLWIYLAMLGGFMMAFCHMMSVWFRQLMPYASRMLERLAMIFLCICVAAVAIASAGI